jgi:hypothetical protein
LSAHVRSASWCSVERGNAQCSYEQIGCSNSDTVETIVYQHAYDIDLAQLVPDIDVAAAPAGSSSAADPVSELVTEYSRNCKLRFEHRVSSRAPENGYTVYYKSVTSCRDRRDKPANIFRMDGQSYLIATGDGQTKHAGSSFDLSNGNNGTSEGWYTESRRYTHKTRAYVNLTAPSGATWKASSPGCYGENSRYLRCSVESVNFK